MSCHGFGRELPRQMPRRRAPKGCLPRVIDDPDIFRAAKLLIDQHGHVAAVRAAMRDDEPLNCNKPLGHLTGPAPAGLCFADV